ncbi:MAG: hypothetical protein U1F10_11805 [Burkholderiales bacterium]
MNTRTGFAVALVVSAMLAGCAATGTRMTSKSESYKGMVSSQQWWCNSFGSTCGCSIDGQKATCSLAQACLNSGNCSVAQ